MITLAIGCGSAAPSTSAAGGVGGAVAIAPVGAGGQGGLLATVPPSPSTAGKVADEPPAVPGRPTDGADAGAEPIHTGLGPAQKKATGYGQATTGGGDRVPIEAASLEALQRAVDAYEGSGGLSLLYTGQFDFDTITDPCLQHTLPAHKLEIKAKHDVTLLGADGSAANFGIHIAADATNIIVRNMKIGLLPGGSDSDMISLEGMSSGAPSDIWIDHNELFSSLAECKGAGDTAFDGMIDIKKGADRVTISYNHLHDHHKASLNGYSDDDALPRHVTFDHNLFENIGSRTPLQRHGHSHLLNNLFTQILTSGINVRMGGYALIEANYFANVLNPVTARDSSAVGYWDLRDNNLTSAADVAPGNPYGITWNDGNSGTVNATDWVTTKPFPDPLGYTYAADSFACVRDGLRATVGPGKDLATLTCGP